jgi:hypothetical protein
MRKIRSESIESYQWLMIPSLLKYDSAELGGIERGQIFPCT